MSPIYRDHSKRGSYHLLGILYERLGKDELTTGRAYLEAAWQERADKSHCDENLKLSEKHLSAFLANPREHRGSLQTARLMMVEIKRRLKKFDESKRCFDDLKAMPDYRDSHVEKILHFEALLIARRDSDPHFLEDVENLSLILTPNEADFLRSIEGSLVWTIPDITNECVSSTIMPIETRASGTITWPRPPQFLRSPTGTDLDDIRRYWSRGRISATGRANETMKSEAITWPAIPQYLRAPTGSYLDDIQRYWNGIAPSAN